MDHGKQRYTRSEFGEEVQKKSIWELGSVPEEASLNVDGEAVTMNRMTPAVTRAGGRTIYQGIIIRNRFLLTFLPIPSLSPHPPNRFWSNLVPIESRYQGASNDVAYRGNDRVSTKEYGNYWESPYWIKLASLLLSKLDLFLSGYSLCALERSSSVLQSMGSFGYDLKAEMRVWIVEFPGSGRF